MSQKMAPFWSYFGLSFNQIIIYMHRIVENLLMQLLQPINLSKTPSKSHRRPYVLCKLHSNPVTLVVYHYWRTTVIDYASTVWDMCAQTHMEHVNSLYRRAAKLILPDPSLSTDDKMRKLNILPLRKQFEYNKSIFMYKITNQLAPSYLFKFLEASQTRYENSRSGFKPSRPRIDLTKTSLGFAGVTLWNSLPNYVRGRPTIASFKKSLQQYLLNND